MTSYWDAVRSEFPSLVRWTYLNTATYGQLPRRAVEAVNRHFARRNEFACADFLSWFDDADRIRVAVARLIRCQPDDVAFAQNASSALAVLLNGIDWQSGDRIVTLEDEFPNNLYISGLCQRLGIEFVQVPWTGFYDSITPSTRLAALSTLNYTTGFRPPLAELSRFLRDRNVLLYLDGTQGIGALAFDAQEILPAMLAVDGYKWLLAPNGAGFMYVRPDLRAALPPNVIGWRSDRGWRQVDHLNHGVPEFSPAAERYEGGMLQFPALYGMEASINLMLDLGPRNIESRVLELAKRARNILEAKGATLLHDRTPILAAHWPDRDASTLASELKAKGILVSARHGNLRVSTHFYNNEADLERLAAAL